MLDDPRYTVPPPGPPGPLGTITWLRATVSRHSEGEDHARRRAIAESLLAELDPAALRAAAASPAADGVELPYVPVAVLADALGARDVPAAVSAVRVIAAAYHPGTEAAGADAAVARLLALLPPDEPEIAAQRIALLVQACEATAALVRGALGKPLEDVLRDDPPVRTTRRIGPDGQLLTVDLHGHPFGYGRRPCPGEAHALALAAGTVEGVR